jgi:hypothetical protein
MEVSIRYIGITVYDEEKGCSGQMQAPQTTNFFKVFVNVMTYSIGHVREVTGS